MYSLDVQFRVSYANTDQMGYMHNGSYVLYYEIARTEILRNLGYSYKKLEENGLMLPVLENHSKYLLPATYDEMITIRVFCREIPLVKWVIEYEFFNEQKQLIHTGSTVLVFIDKQSRKPCRAPQDILDLVKPYFEK
ncbi:MAG: acyl-CoA thioesterase [Bacteroidetes bacterium]|nr:MAG: acyl-CoA thioesterase [Bacteroidota bacterium]